MSEDKVNTGERFLLQLESRLKDYNYPVLTDDRGFTYVIVKRSALSWQIKKLGSNNSITIYNQNKIRGKWICDCPAGVRNYSCKHVVWVLALAEGNSR